jgi:hypothetical protein
VYAGQSRHFDRALVVRNHHRERETLETAPDQYAAGKPLWIGLGGGKRVP